MYHGNCNVRQAWRIHTLSQLDTEFHCSQRTKFQVSVQGNTRNAKNYISRFVKEHFSVHCQYKFAYVDISWNAVPWNLCLFHFERNGLTKIYTSVTMVYYYNYHNSGYIYRPVLYLRTRRFGNWIMSLSSSGTYSDAPNRKRKSLSPVRTTQKVDPSTRPI
jgi:hypothetical protein